MVDIITLIFMALEPQGGGGGYGGWHPPLSDKGFSYIEILCLSPDTSRYARL